MYHVVQGIPGIMNGLPEWGSANTSLGSLILVNVSCRLRTASFVLTNKNNTEQRHVGRIASVSVPKYSQMTDTAKAVVRSVPSLIESWV